MINDNRKKLDMPLQTWRTGVQITTTAKVLKAGQLIDREEWCLGSRIL